MTYDLKWAEETAWAIIVAALTYIVGVAAAGMPTDNWKIWAMTVAAGVGRVVVATLISRLGSKPATSANLSVVNVPASEYTTSAAPSFVVPVYSAGSSGTSFAYSADPTTGLVAQTPPDKVLANTLPDHTGTLPRLQASSPPDPLS